MSKEITKDISAEANARRLSTGELEKVSGGKVTYTEMNGDTYISSGNGSPQRVTSNWGWPLSLVLN
jgi:hypothetical protein